MSKFAGHFMWYPDESKAEIFNTVGSMITASLDTILSRAPRAALIIDAEEVAAVVYRRANNKFNNGKVWGLGDQGDVKTLILFSRLQRFGLMQLAASRFVFKQDLALRNIDPRARLYKLPLIAYIEECKRIHGPELELLSAGRELDESSSVIYDIPFCVLFR